LSGKNIFWNVSRAWSSSIARLILLHILMFACVIRYLRITLWLLMFSKFSFLLSISFNWGISEFFHFNDLKDIEDYWNLLYNLFIPSCSGRIQTLDLGMLWPVFYHCATNFSWDVTKIINQNYLALPQKISFVKFLTIFLNQSTFNLQLTLLNFILL